MKGRFITFEGGEGCGKSTHIALLAERLRQSGIEVVLTREPGGTPLCEEIRNMLQHDSCGESPCPEAETLLFCASRAQLIDKVIRPALERGAWVLSDRFADSTIAYQGYGRGFPLPTLRAILAFATGGLSPDATFLLEVSPEVEADRLAKRYSEGQAIDRFEREASAFHKRVRQGFLEIAKSEPERVIRILTDKAKEQVHQEILSEIESRLNLSIGAKIC